MKYRTLLLFVVAGGLASAQPPDARGYRDNNGQTYGERDMARTAASTAAGNASSPIMKVDKRAVDEMVEAFKANNRGPYINIPPPAGTGPSAEARRERYEMEREMEYLHRVSSQLNNSVLPPLDRSELVRMAYFCDRNNYTPEDRLTPALAFVAFLRDSATASYDTLRSRAWDARCLPYACMMCYASLRRRFPEQLKRTENNEFTVMMYVFGAIRPQLYPEMTAYPESTYELADESEKARLLARFERLATAHSDVALKVAGYCRSHINPYLMMAERPAVADDYRAVCYTNVLFTIYPPHKLTTTDPAYWRDYADRRLRKAAVWLMANSPDRIAKLTKEDWQRIIQSQGLRADDVAWAFRENERAKNYQNRIPALYAVWKEAR